MKLSKTTISDREITLFDDAVNVLGPKLELRNCSLNLECSAAALVFAGVIMHGGSISATRGLTNFQFENISLREVSVTGTFTGVDFGSWENAGLYPIEEIDLSRGNLHLCRLINCETSKVVFPAWPCVVILNPWKAAGYINSVSWPGKISSPLKACTDQDKECVAAVLNAQILAKRAGVTAQEVRSLIRNIPGVSIS